MARRGRKPKPTSLKILAGTRSDRINHSEPVVPADRFDPPSWLEGPALVKWHELAPQLVTAGVARNLDVDSLARYCWTWHQWQKHSRLCERGADVLVMKDESTGKVRYAQVAPSATLVVKYGAILARLESEFGMTPSSRSSIVTGQVPADPIDAWLQKWS